MAGWLKAIVSVITGEPQRKRARQAAKSDAHYAQYLAGESLHQQFMNNWEANIGASLGQMATLLGISFDRARALSRGKTPSWYRRSKFGRN